VINVNAYLFFIGTVGEIANHSFACGFSYLDLIY